MTLLESIQLFSDIHANHKFLKTGGFNYGNFQQISPNVSYPGFFVNNVSTVPIESHLIRTFEVYIVDLVNQDRSNEQNVKSNCEESLLEIIEFLRKESIHYTLVNEPQILTVDDTFGDAVSGVQCELSLRMVNDKTNYCGLPFDLFGLDPNFNVECATGFDSYSGFSGFSGRSGYSGFSGFDGLSAQVYTQEFNGTTDWTSLGGFYYIEITHNLNSFALATDIWDTSGTYPVKTLVEILEMNTADMMTIRVPADPDQRFSGRIVITGTTGVDIVMGYSGFSGFSGMQGIQGLGLSGYSGVSGFSGKSGYSGVVPDIIYAWITDTTAISQLTNASNWDIEGVWIEPSPALSNTYQGQMLYDGNYFYIMIDDNSPIRLIRG
jgi:hypothetical protein